MIIRKNIVYFNNSDDLGVFNLPIKSLIYISDIGDGTAKLIEKISNDSITESTTISDFLELTDNYKEVTSAGSGNSDIIDGGTY